MIDAETKAITAHWKLTKAADNVPMAFDGEDQLLFVACRKPGMVIALDAATGKEIASQPAAGGADDLFYDPALGRVYLISGAGEVDAYQVDKAKSSACARQCCTPRPEPRRRCLFPRRIFSILPCRARASIRRRFEFMQQSRAESPMKNRCLGGILALAMSLFQALAALCKHKVAAKAPMRS